MQILEADWISNKTMKMPLAFDADDTSFLTRVEVYRKSKRLIDEVFRKSFISVGRSTRSDVVLPDIHISRNHFYLYIDNHNIFVLVKPGKQALSINGQSVNAAQIGPEETIEVGPYTLRIRVRLDDDPPRNETDMRYQVVFEGNIQDGFNRSGVAKDLKTWLKIDGQQTALLFSGKSVVVREDLDLQAAVDFKTQFEKYGAKAQVQAVVKTAEADDRQFDDMSIALRSDPKDTPPDAMDTAPQRLRPHKEAGQRTESAAQSSKAADTKPKSRKTGVHPSGPAGRKPKTGKSAERLFDRRKKEKQRAESPALADAGSEENAAQVAHRIPGEPKEEDIDPHRSGDQPKNGKSAKLQNIRGLKLPNSAWPFAGSVVDDEDDEDEDDIEAGFSLKEVLSNSVAYDRRRQQRAPKSARSVGVFKFRQDAVIDVSYLGSNQSYHIDSNTGRFRLAQKNGSKNGYLYFNKNHTGKVHTKGSGSAALSDFLTAEHLVHKRKGIYRLPIPDTGTVFINDGCFDYLIRLVHPSQSPVVSETRPTKALSWKHGAFSVLAHMIFLAVLMMMSATVFRNTPEPETRFVTVDPHIMDQLQPKPKPVVKPPPAPPKKTKPAPKPVQKKAPVKKKTKVAKKKPVVKPKTAKKAKRPLKKASAKVASKKTKTRRQAAVSRDPQAGGGHGKGNIAKRNVKQVGLLAMLGDSQSTGVDPAITDVTNLDAVRSGNSGQAKFKVGGIKGKLGTSEISVSSGDVVATKGNSQVLRSYGAGGSGRVAALEKGSVGQKQVKGMVQASLSKSVRIRGGMSREAVKRVIQQHLDEITYCYETALISNPSIKGKITMEWKIRMSGTVGEVRIKSSTIKSPEIYSCIKSAIKSWRFPKPVGNEVIVSYPFIFDVVGF